jgi:hypothetical protein
VKLVYRVLVIVGVFYTGKNRVVKIARTSSEMILWTTKHTMIYLGSVSSLKVIALHPVVWYWRWTEVIMRWTESLRSLHGEGENNLVPLPVGYGAFYRPSQRSDNYKLIIFISRNRFTWLVGPQSWECRFVEVGRGFHDVILGSRAFCTLRWMMHGMILGEVAS